jgi:putative spermidine/putrescine transport system permease protein
MTSNVTTPALYAIGTITTVLSLAVIALAFWAIAIIQKRRGKRAALS